MSQAALPRRGVRLASNGSVGHSIRGPQSRSAPANSAMCSSSSRCICLRCGSSATRGRKIDCLAIRPNLLFRQQYPTLDVREGNDPYKSPEDNVPNLRASSGPGARMDGMVNICALSINVVTSNKPKDADRLEPKGHVVGTETYC